MKTDSNIKRVKVLGVGIDDVSMEEGIKIVENWLCHGGDPDLRQDDILCHAEPRLDRGNLVSASLAPACRQGRNASKLIFTPGPEFLVTAQSDPDFKNILNSADLNIPDGYGLKIFGNITNIIPGVDFMLALCKLAQKKSFTVGLLGGTTGVAKKTKDKLETMFPGIKIIFALDGKDADRVVIDYDALRYVDILFVALGHPKQEKFLNVILERAKRSDRIYFCVGMGVGGSFDLISGKIKRAPGILQKLKLEWFWRLILEPKRIKRIFTAVVIFPVMIFRKNLLQL